MVAVSILFNDPCIFNKCTQTVVQVCAAFSQLIYPKHHFVCLVVGILSGDRNLTVLGVGFLNEVTAPVVCEIVLCIPSVLRLFGNLVQIIKFVVYRLVSILLAIIKTWSLNIK
ncbi:hypothetical protein SDC9_50959 [bioreactor metagenome]|uniref:Uncharacterized protein n=1 Tax=bioreactor metagenome TaxID=1076179 RepID=A0A644WLM8_9ZZZZ